MSTLKETILSRLALLEPLQINLVDESDKHRGHAGAENGAKHFRLFIVSELFQNSNALQRHRMIFKQLTDLIPHPVHALAIHAYTPAEYEHNKPF